MLAAIYEGLLKLDWSAVTHIGHWPYGAHWKSVAWLLWVFDLIRIGNISWLQHPDSVVRLHVHVGAYLLECQHEALTQPSMMM